MAESLKDKQVYIFFLLLLIAGVVFGSIAIIYPFGRDQGIYAYAGKLILDGKIDYKYAFDLKPPGVHYVFAAAQLFGKSMMSFRIFDLFWQFLTGVALFLIVHRLTSSKFTGLMAGLLYLFLYFRMDYWHTLQADGFLNLPFALSVLLLVSIDNENSLGSIFLSGLLFGITLIFKYTVLLYLPLLVIVFLFWSQNKVSRKLINIFVYSGGLLLAVLIILGIYLVTGALSYFIDIQFIQTPLYAKIGFETESVDFITANIIRLFFGSVYSPLIWFSIVLLISLVVSKQLSYQYSILFAWIISTIIGLIVQWKFFLYHFLVIIPPLSIGAAVLFLKYRGKFISKYPRFVPVSIFVVITVYFVLGFKPYVKNYEDLYSYMSGKKNLEEIYITKGITADSAFMIGNTFRAITFIESNTSIKDKIYVWGFDPLIYYLSGRDCVSRFIYNFPLYWKENNKEFQAEFLEELNKEKPKLILVSQRDPLFFISGYKGDSKSMLNKFESFKTFIENYYVFKTQLDDFYFYESKKEPKVN